MDNPEFARFVTVYRTKTKPPQVSAPMTAWEAKTKGDKNTAQMLALAVRSLFSRPIGAEVLISRDKDGRTLHLRKVAPDYSGETLDEQEARSYERGDR